MNESNLILGVFGLPPESARNCIQELYPIPNGEFKRSINGDMLFLESTERKRYKSTISCKDLNTPIIDGIWVGSKVNVGCIQHLWQSISPGDTATTLIRPAVDSSICVIDKSGNPLKFNYSNNIISIYKTHQERIFVCFRPWLAMQIIDFSMETNEWSMSGGWKLVLEEI